MKTRNEFFVLTVLTLILTFSVSSQAAEAKGEVAISDNGSELQVKLKMTIDKPGGSASGFFQYSDNQNKVFIKVTCLKIDGEYAWFAGQCVEDGVDYLGRWFFGAVHDGGTPGRLVDHIWWEWIPESDNAESIAKSKVRNMEVPSERKKIQSGDIKVND